MSREGSSSGAKRWTLYGACRLTPHLPPVAEGASAVLVYCVKLSRCVTFYVRVVSIETLTHIYPNSFSSASAVYTFALPHDLSSHIQLRIQLQRSALLNSQFDSDHSRCTARDSHTALSCLWDCGALARTPPPATRMWWSVRYSRTPWRHAWWRHAQSLLLSWGGGGGVAR